MDPLDLAIHAARTAGTLLLASRNGPLDVREKGARGDLVTSADRAAEAAIVAILRAAMPGAAILGEEGGVTAGSTGERWIVDPLDGTTNYAHGYPLFCVSIAYERDGIVEAGVVYAPALRELYSARRGGGAFCEGRRLAVSTVATVAEAMVCTGFKPADYARNGAHFAHLSRRAQAVRRDGSAALDLAFVARGRFDAFWEFDLAPWDVAAGALLVREAGGSVGRIGAGTFEVDGRSILATNGAIDPEMRQQLTSVPEVPPSGSGEMRRTTPERAEMDSTHDHAHEHAHTHDHEHEHDGVVHAHEHAHEHVHPHEHGAGERDAASHDAAAHAHAPESDHAHDAAHAHDHDH